MHKKALIVFAIAGVAVLASGGQSHACGDKLSMIGGGVSFERIHQTRHPGNVVVLSAPGSTASPAQDLKRSLERAGHRVRTVADESELKGLIVAGDVDVVLVDLTGPGDVASLANSGNGRGPAVLAVAYGNAGGAEPASTTSRNACVTRADKRRGYEVVEAVDRAIERRKKGLPAACESGQRADAI